MCLAAERQAAVAARAGAHFESGPVREHASRVRCAACPTTTRSS
jgi:hypothetical protein